MFNTTEVKHTCSKCGKGVRTGMNCAIYCNGLCKSYIHLKCVNLLYSTIGKLSDEELGMWKCSCCMNQNQITDITRIKEFVQYEQPVSDVDIEPSLTLEGELSKSLLLENEDLKQELHNSKIKKSMIELELEDKLWAKEEQLNHLKFESEKREEELDLRIKFLEEKLRATKKINETFFQQADHEKDEIDSKLNQLNTQSQNCNINQNCNCKKEKKTIETQCTIPPMLVNKSTSTTQSDFSVIHSTLSNDWLTDDAIDLYLKATIDKGLIDSGTCVIAPAVSHTIKCLDDYDLHAKSLFLHDKSFVIAVVNDGKPSLGVAGQHWSLLFYDRLSNTFYYFDSLNEKNLPHARNMYH